MLASKGLPTTGSLAASSFQKYGTGVKARGRAARRHRQFQGPSHVGFFAGFGPNGTVRILGGNQGKPGQGRRQHRQFQAQRRPVGAPRRAPSAKATTARTAKRSTRCSIAAAQDSFNKKLETEAATARAGHQVYARPARPVRRALYNSQRRKEIEKAILAAKQEATDKHIAFSPDQEAALRKQIGDQYDAEHAMQLVNDRIKEQTDLRSHADAGIAEASQHGDDATVARLTEQLNALTPALEDAIERPRSSGRRCRTRRPRLPRSRASANCATASRTPRGSWTS
jgi:hypothetical protein